MVTMRDIKRTAASYGGTVAEETTSDGKRYNVEAPEGQQWVEGGVLSIVFETFRYETSDERQHTLTDAIERMGYGLEPADED